MASSETSSKELSGHFRMQCGKGWGLRAGGEECLPLVFVQIPSVSTAWANDSTLCLGLSLHRHIANDCSHYLIAPLQIVAI